MPANFNIPELTPYQGLKMKVTTLDLKPVIDAINNDNTVILQQAQADAARETTVTKVREALPDTMKPYVDAKYNDINSNIASMIEQGNPRAALKYAMAEGARFTNDQNIVNASRNWDAYNKTDDANKKMVDGEHVTQREYDYWKAHSGVFNGGITIDENGNEVYQDWKDAKPLLKHLSKQEKAAIAKQLLTPKQTSRAFSNSTTTPGSSDSVSDDKSTSSSTRESFTTGRSGHNNTVVLDYARIHDLFTTMNVDLEPIRQEYNALSWEQSKYVDERNSLIDKQFAEGLTDSELERLNQLNYVVSENHKRLYDPQGISYNNNLYEWMARECVGWEKALIINHTDVASSRIDKDVVTGNGRSGSGGSGGGAVLPPRLPMGPQPGMGTKTGGDNTSSYLDADGLFFQNNGGRDPNSYSYPEYPY